MGTGERRSAGDETAVTLTAKQRAWADHYVVCLNATEAARRAGYAGDDNVLGVIGYENLRKPKIVEYLNSLFKAQTIKPEEVLARLSEHATGSIAEFITVKHGIPYLDFEKAEKAGKLHLIKKINYSDKTGNLESVELYDAQSALVHLGKAYALFTNKIETVTWETKALEYIRDGKVKYAALVSEYGEDLATKLFKQAGVPVEVE